VLPFWIQFGAFILLNYISVTILLAHPVDTLLNYISVTFIV